MRHPSALSVERERNDRLTASLEPARKALLEVAAGLRSAFSHAPEPAQSNMMPLGAVVAAEAQTKEKVQVDSELVRQTETHIHERDAARQEHTQQEAHQMTSPTQPPEDIRTPGTPIRPANIPADERDATQPGAAASESAPVIPPDTRVRESEPVIPTDLDEDQGVAATLPKGTARRESAPVIPSGKPGQERAPVIPADEGLPLTEPIIPDDRPQEASAPVIPTDAQKRQTAQEAEDLSSPSASEATRDTPMSPE